MRLLRLTRPIGVLLTFVCSVSEPATARAQTNSPAQPIDLPSVLRLAGAQNLDVQLARERLAEAVATRASARWQFFPWLAPGVTYRRHEDRLQDVAGNIFDANKQAYSPGATVAAQVDLGEAIYRSLAAKQLVAAAQYELEAQRQEAILGAAVGYFDLVKAQANVGVAREAFRISRNYQDQLHEAVAAGLAFKGDELRVQVQTERYEMTLRQALEQVRTAAARLAQTLHLDPVVELTPRDPAPVLMTLVPTNQALASLVEQALANRPELKQTRAIAAAARRAKQGAQFGPLVPSVGAQAFVGGLGGGKDDRLGGLGKSEDFSAFLGWRIGAGGLFDASRVKAAEARLAGARLAEEKRRDQVVREIVESQTRAQSLADQVAVAQKNLATAAESLRLAEQRQEFAVGVVLEVIQAQQELTRARSDYLANIAEYDKTQYALSRALGFSTPSDRPLGSRP